MIEDDPLEKSYDSKLLLRLLTYLRPYLWPVCASFVLLIAMAGLGLIGPYLTKIAIDEHIRKRDAQGLVSIAALYLLALALSFAVRFGQVSILQMTGQRVMLDMRRQIFGHL